MLLKKVILAFIPPIAVFALHILLVIGGFYFKAEWIDIPIHFLGGASIGYTFTSLLQIAKRKKLLGKTHNAILLILVTSLVSLIAVFWELAEYLLAAATQIRWQSTISDTMLDLLMGLLGAPIGFLIRNKDK